VYENYGNSEINLRNKAVEELNKVKAKIQDGEGENVEKKDKVWRTTWKEPKSNQDEEPKVKMMRAQPIEELEDQRLIEIQRRGAMLDEEYQRLLEENEIEQRKLNQRSQECDKTEDKTDLMNASFDQIIFDNQMRKRYDNIYRKERELRIGATNYLRESHTR